MVWVGIAWCIVGIGVITGASDPPPGIAFEVAPAWLRAALWVGSGLYASWCGLRMRGTSRALGWLVIMPVVRLASYLLAWLLWMWPGEQVGEWWAGWYIGATYIGMIGVVLLCGAIPERFYPPQRVRREQEEASE